MLCLSLATHRPERAATAKAPPTVVVRASRALARGSELLCAFAAHRCPAHPAHPAQQSPPSPPITRQRTAAAARQLAVDIAQGAAAFLAPSPGP